MMNWLSIVRLAVLSFTFLAGVIALGLGAHIISLSEEYYEEYFVFSALAVATGALTLLSVPVMILIDLLRNNAFTSLVVVELSWLSVLWILWLSTGAVTASQISPAFDNCDFINTIINGVCHESQAVEAFSFLAWIFLLGYTITLLVVALVNANRGAPMWFTTVRESGGLVPASQVSYPAQQQQQQQQPLAMSQPQSQQPLGQQYPPQPVPSPASVPASNGSYGTYPQV